MRFILTLALAFFTTLPAHAALSENAIRQFVQVHNQIVGSCDPQQIARHLNENFSGGYSATVKPQGGEPMKMTKAQLLTELSQMMKLLGDDEQAFCVPPFQPTSIKIDGNTGHFDTLDTETTTVEENGQQVTYSAKMACRNNVMESSGKVVITKTYCIASETKK